MLKLQHPNDFHFPSAPFLYSHFVTTAIDFLPVTFIYSLAIRRTAYLAPILGIFPKISWLYEGTIAKKCNIDFFFPKKSEAD